MSPSFSRLFLPVAVLLTVFLAYRPSLEGDFVNWDDNLHLVENSSVRSLDRDHLKTIFTSTINDTYIPLTTLSFALEHHFFGLDPFIYHLDNVLLHLIVTALVMVLASRLGLPPLAAALTGLIFGLHPLHVEAVAWVTARKDVLYATFYLLSLLIYLDYLDERKRHLLFLSVIFGLLSVLTKPMAISLPLIVLLCDWFYGRKIDRTALFEKAYYLAVMVPVMFVTYFANSYWMGYHSASDILIWIWSFMFYVTKFIVPAPQVLIYETPVPVSLQNPAYMVTLVLFAGFLALVWLLRKNRLVVFAFFFYALSIFFLMRLTLQVIPVSDRFMYLPSAGWCMVLAIAIQRMFEWSRRNAFLFCGVLVLFGLLLSSAFVKTSAQCRVWNNSVSLWTNQLAAVPKTSGWFVYSVLADAYTKDPSMQESLLRIRMRNAGEWDLKRAQMVIDLYRLSSQRKPEFPENYFGQARIYDAMGDEAQAVRLYQKTVELAPANFKALYNLGAIAQEQGMPEEAVTYYRRAIAASLNNAHILEDVLASYQDSIRHADHADVYAAEAVRIQQLIHQKNYVQ